MPAVSRETLRQESAKLIGCLLNSGTMTGGSATSITHTGNGGLRDSGASESLYVGAYVLITSGADDGNWRVTTPTGYDEAAGTLTVGEAWSTGGANSTTYELLVGLNPDEWNDVIDDALVRLRYRYRSPLTICVDGDMETSGDANWTDTNATDTKVTTGDFVNGTQALEVTNTAANGYVQSDSIPCNPGDSFFVWANYRTTGTARLRLWDVTNGASLATDTGVDEGRNNEGGMIFVSGATTSGSAGTRNVAVRLIGEGASDVVYWDDVIVMRAARRRYELPSWVVDRDMIREVRQRHGIRVNEFYYTTVGWPLDIEEDQTAVNIFTLVLPQGGMSRPLYLFGERSYAALSTDASTTNCPLELAKYAVASEALERMGKTWERVSAAGMAIDKAELGRRLAQMQRRLLPRTSKPIGDKTEWVVSI